MSIRHDGGKQLVEPVRPPLEIQPAEQRLQGGGGLVLLPAGGPGDGVGRGIPSPAEHAALLLVQQREDACGGGSLGGGGHILHSGPVQVFGLGPAVETESGADHYLKHAVSQMGQPQAGQGEQEVPGHIQVKIICHIQHQP